MENKWHYLILAFSAFLLSCHSDVNSVEFVMTPQPTDGTVVKEDMEEGGERQKREAWIELLHQSAPGIYWRSVEAERDWKAHLQESKLNSLQKRTNGPVSIADGRLLGTWQEKGSDNLAGSVIATAFLQEEESIYVVGAGGCLYKGDLEGENWQVVNQDLRFGGQLLEFVQHQGKRRLIGIVNRAPAWSEDDGATWVPAADWITYTDGWGSVYFPVISRESKHIVTLAKEGYWSNLAVFVSDDGGASFQRIMSLGSHEPDKYFLCAEQNSDRVILVDKANDDNIDFYTYVPNEKRFELESLSRSKGFGPSGRANLASTRIDDTTSWYYIFDQQNIVHFSPDLGRSWEKRDTIGERPWGVGLFVSPSDPEFLLAGAVQCYRSHDGGRSISMINRWQDYYNSVAYKLHADMMFFNEFEDKDGQPFVTISNHGGLNLSWDKAVTTPSISLEGLNVSQYYSVRTDPFYRDYIYAGSQDQGFQRGKDMDDGAVSFDQIISGDYGHIVFSAGGSNMWTVYPGGWVIYYDMPRDQRYPLLSYTIDSDDETVWIPPLAEIHSPPGDAVLVAGGSIYGGPGSHLIYLERVGGELVASQFDFDFKAASGGGTVSAIHQNAVDPDIYYVATTNGNFYTSPDRGLSWTKALMKVPGGHYLYGSSIVSSWTNKDVFYAGGSGYSNAPVVWSNDGGRVIRPFREGMPSTTVFQLALDPEERFLFAATEDGPYVCLLDEGKWYPMAEGIAPNQTYWTVEYLYPEDIVRFGTYGRGIWDFEIESLNSSITDRNVTGIDWDFYPNPAVDQINLQLPESGGREFGLTLHTFDGKGLRAWDRVSAGQVVDLSGVPSGNYLLGLRVGTHIHWKKIMIQ